MIHGSRRTLVLATLVLCGFGFAGSVSADQFDEVRGWLERMAKAMQEMDYQGTFVYVRGDEVETIRLTHVRRDGQVLERMVAVSGPAREVVRDAHGVHAIIGEPGEKLDDPLISGAVFPDIPVAALEQAREPYAFELGELGRIAGHLGRRISIAPRDRYRYGYELWLETESGLLLRWVLYDANQRPLAKLMFTDLVTGDAVDPEELRSDVPEDRFLTVSAASPRAEPAGADSRAASSGGAPQVGPVGLPAGFRLAMHARNEAQPDFEHLVYSDGLASVSVYLESSAGQGGIPEGLSRMGTTNAWSRSRAKRRVTAIGEVPPITLKTIGNAFLEEAAAAAASNPGAE